MPTANANGKKFTFPDGTTPDQMGQAIDEYFAASTLKKQAPLKWPAPNKGVSKGAALQTL